MPKRIIFLLFHLLAIVPALYSTFFKLGLQFAIMKRKRKDKKKKPEIFCSQTFVCKYPTLRIRYLHKKVM